MSTSYDLSPLYRHSTSHLIPSTSTLVSSHGSKLISRKTSTLQITRTWSLPLPGGGPINSITISRQSPHLILVYSPACAWVLDPESDGIIAKLEIGKVQGCQGILLDPIKHETLIVWAENHSRLSLYNLTDPNVNDNVVYQIIQSPKLNFIQGGYSFSDRYFALLERHENRDCIAIYDPLSNWSRIRNIVISDPTSDLTNLKWSPNGNKYFVVWSHITHYYLHVYTTDGRLMKTFKPSPSSSSSYVGLGIRTIVWSLDGEFFAVGGYDGKIRVLSRVASWNVVAELSCPHKITSNSTTIWREPSPGWVEKTLGKGIITFNQIETCTKKPYLIHNDLVGPDSTKPFPKMGWSKLVWSRNGQWLIGYNQSYPNHLYIFQFLVPSSSSSSSSSEARPRIIRPKLHTLILLNSPPKTFEFKPTTTTTTTNETETLVILSGSNCFTIWTSTLRRRRRNSTKTTKKSTGSSSEEGSSEEEEVGYESICEGIGIPTPESTNFNPNMIEFSSADNKEEEEEVILLGEKGGMFCLVYPVKDNLGGGTGGGEGDRTWIEGEDY